MLTKTQVDESSFLPSAMNAVCKVVVEATSNVLRHDDPSGRVNFFAQQDDDPIVCSSVAAYLSTDSIIAVAAIETNAGRQWILPLDIQ